MDRGDIFIPPFQRDYVWTLKEASRFVESLLLGLPVPGIFLARDPDTKKLLVIDGQQRLKTLQFFFNGYFNPNPQAKTKRVFKLNNVQDQFDGLTYETLRDDDRIIFNDSIIHATIVKQESPEDDNTSIYHIFERLNTSGRKLTPQQIRVAIYPGSFIEMIKRLNEYESWRNIFGKKSPTLKDQELILRFLALYFEAGSYRRPIKEFLNKFTQKHRKEDDEFLSKCENIFMETIDIAFQSIGGRAFRPERALNTAVFDSVMIGLAKGLVNNAPVNHGQIREVYYTLLDHPDYVEAVSQATSDEKNVNDRLRIATEAFANI